MQLTSRGHVPVEHVVDIDWPDAHNYPVSRTRAGFAGPTAHSLDGREEGREEGLPPPR